MTRPTLPPPPAQVRCAKRLEVVALEGVPIVEPGDDLAKIVLDALRDNQWTLADGDVIVITSKLLSRAEGRFFDLSVLDVSEEAERLAKETNKDARLVELVLRDTRTGSRKADNVLIVRHRLGFVSANAGIDASNAAPPHAPPGSGPWALVMPKNPDKTAEWLRAALHQETGAQIGIIVTDSFGRPFRIGTVGTAVGRRRRSGRLRSARHERPLRPSARVDHHGASPIKSPRLPISSPARPTRRGRSPSSEA